MPHHPLSLLELALAEQEARNCAALVAIKARATDLLETQHLVAALGAHGAKIRAVVDTQPVGAQALCRIVLWLSATRPEFEQARQWLLANDIALTRLHPADVGEVLAYELTLRTQKLRLNVALHDPIPRPFRFVRANVPEAA